MFGIEGGKTRVGKTECVNQCVHSGWHLVEWKRVIIIKNRENVTLAAPARRALISPYI